MIRALKYDEAKKLQTQLELMGYPGQLYYVDKKWKVQVEGIITEDRKVVDTI